ncbi:MAG: amidohydrolase family protein [Rubrivivax sp.]|nr:amidohydrolase family protein [Rubrivivax sp.]
MAGPRACARGTGRAAVARRRAGRGPQPAAPDALGAQARARTRRPPGAAGRPPCAAPAAGHAGVRRRRARIALACRPPRRSARTRRQRADARLLRGMGAGGTAPAGDAARSRPARRAAAGRRGPRRAARLSGRWPRSRPTRSSARARARPASSSTTSVSARPSSSARAGVKRRGAQGPGLRARGYEFSSSRDIGPAARKHPDMDFLVYHAGFDTQVKEGPHDAGATFGVDALVRSVVETGRPRNVYAELGSTWRFVMRDPDQAAHLLGKLLVAFGEDHILWGTDSIWYGSPQDQIQAFRAFQISASSRSASATRSSLRPSSARSWA